MKQLLVLLFLLCSASISAQDVIVKKDGSTIVCRVVNLTDSEIIYKKWSNLNGSNYVMERSAASAINYENGKKVKLSEATNLYKPNNQNDGVQQYNDNTLLRIDFDANKIERKIKRLKTASWIGGIVGLGVGGYFLYLASKSGVNRDEKKQYIIGGVSCFAGVACFTTCQLIANHYKKKAMQFETYNIIKYDFKLDNGTSLSAGIDMISDQTINSKTFGLGLRYNF